MRLPSIIRKKMRSLEYRWAQTSPERYIRFLRRKGVKIGKNLWVTPGVKSLSIDITRPSLLEIGDNVRLNRNLTIITHDGSFYVLRNKYKEFIATSGRVKIGNNVYFGRNCTVFKGVTIGDNCIIGFGSIVTKDIPSNSIAVGVPAKVVADLDDYYNKRKRISIEEALDYARSIQERFGRRPVPADFWEEFPLFLNRDDLPDDIPVKFQLGPAYDHYRQHHQPVFDNFEDFLAAAGLTPDSDSGEEK